jgi:ubiquitin-protein ligase E3 A
MPSMARSLEYILKNTDANLEETLYQTFTVELDMFGQSQVHELIPDGGDIFVGQENKEEYVYMLVDFIFNTHCEEQFKAFKRGFYKVVSEDIIQLFKPEELEALVCGSKALEFKDLEAITQYVDGYTQDNPVIKWLWEIIHNDMTDVERKQFL